MTETTLDPPGRHGDGPPPTIDAADGGREWNRLPPHNIYAEKALFGAIFAFEHKAYEDVAETGLTPDHFAVGAHVRIYEAVQSLFDRGQIANPVTLRRLFEQDETLQEVGGPAYLMELAAAGTDRRTAVHYARMIIDLSRKREMIDICSETVERAHTADVETTSDALIEEIEGKLYGVAENGATGGGVVSASSALTAALDRANEAYRRGDGLVGLPTGFSALDDLLGGLAPSDLVILAGRPSMGKTALALGIARHLGLAGTDVGMYSLEMSAEQLMSRLVSMIAGVSYARLMRGKLNGDEYRRVVAATPEARKLPLHIDHRPGQSIERIATGARRMKRRFGIKLLIVDYLQLIRAKAENRTQEVTRITSGLKNIAKELDIPVLALSQLSRNVEQRDNKRPMMADLRDSGSIEQDADQIWFAFREHYYLKRDEPQLSGFKDSSKHGEALMAWMRRLDAAEGKAEIIVAKQRHGPDGTAKLRFVDDGGRFENEVGCQYE